MGRMKPAYYYERQAAEAVAREAYYRTRTPSDTTTVKNRPTTTLYYNSLLVRNGADAVVYKVSPSTAGLGIITAAEAGLMAAPPTGKQPLNMRSSGVTPTKIHWYKGDATPSASRTPWNSRVIKYYDSTGTQSHYSLPFSRVVDTFDSRDLQTAFNALFSGTRRTTLLGAENGRAYLELEKVPIATDT